MGGVSGAGSGNPEIPIRGAGKPGPTGGAEGKDLRVPSPDLGRKSPPLKGRVTPPAEEFDESDFLGGYERIFQARSEGKPPPLTEGQQHNANKNFAHDRMAAGTKPAYQKMLALRYLVGFGTDTDSEKGCVEKVLG